MVATITSAWKQLHSKFTTAGVPPSTYVMYNEISDDLLRALKVINEEYQLVPLRSHRRNPAERTIQTWKNHFKTGLVSVDPVFPLTE